MKRTLYPVLLSLGLGIGIMAGGLASAWPDILLAAGMILFQLGPTAFLPVLRRRFAAAERT
jgi:hypothetical protein